MNNKKLISSIMKKELLDIVKTFKFIILMGIFSFNLLIYTTDTKIYELGQRGDIFSYKLGNSTIFLTAMAIIFIGHILLNRLFYDEKRTKTIHVLLSMGVSKTKIWLAKLLSVFLVCIVITFITLLIHYGVVYYFFGVIIKFTLSSAIMAFITMPLLAFASLALVSVAYMYFARMNMFGMLLQIAPFLFIWQASVTIMNLSNIPSIIVILSIVVSISCILLSAFFMKLIPKEKIITRVD